MTADTSSVSSPDVPDHRPVFFAVSACFFVLFAYYSFFARFMVLVYTEYGLDAGEIGFLGLLNIIAGVPSSSIWGLIADKTGRRKEVLCCCITLSAIFQTMLYFAPHFQNHWSRFVYCCVMSTSYTILRGNDYSQLRGVTMRCLSRCNRQTAYGKLRLWGAVSWGIAHPLLGWLLDAEHGDLFPLFAGNALAATTVVVCIMFLLRSEWTDEQVPSEVSPSSECQADNAVSEIGSSSLAGPKASMREVLSIICSSPEMLSMLVCSAACSMGMQHVFNFLFLFMKERFQAPDSLMGASVTVTVLFEVPIFALGESLVPKLGPVVLISIAMASFAVRVLGYTLVPSAALLLFLEPLHGVTYSCFTLATVHYVNDHVPMRIISTTQGLMSSVTGLGSAIGVIFGGWVMDQPDGGLLLFRSDAVVMSLVLTFFLLSQLRPKSRARNPALLGEAESISHPA